MPLAPVALAVAAAAARRAAAEAERREQSSELAADRANTEGQVLANRTAAAAAARAAATDRAATRLASASGLTATRRLATAGGFATTAASRARADVDERLLRSAVVAATPLLAGHRAARDAATAAARPAGGLASTGWLAAASRLASAANRDRTPASGSQCPRIRRSRQATPRRSAPQRSNERRHGSRPPGEMGSSVSLPPKGPAILRWRCCHDELAARPNRTGSLVTRSARLARAMSRIVTTCAVSQRRAAVAGLLAP